MVGQSIKYEPAWVTAGLQRYQTRNYMRPSSTYGPSKKQREHHELLVANKADEVLKSATLSMQNESL